MAKADPDPPLESQGETSDGAPAPGSDEPSPDSPGYRLQDFDTLATVGESALRAGRRDPARRGAPSPGDAGSQTKDSVSGRSLARPPPGEAWARPRPAPPARGPHARGDPCALGPSDAARVGESPLSAPPARPSLPVPAGSPKTSPPAWSAPRLAPPQGTVLTFWGSFRLF